MNFVNIFIFLLALKSWEQDLRNRSKILPQNNEGGKVSNSEYFPVHNENSNSGISKNISKLILPCNQIHFESVYFISSVNFF